MEVRGPAPETCGLALESGVLANRHLSISLHTQVPTPCAPPVTHLLVLRLEQGNFLLHLADVAGGFGHLGPLQVPLGQQLLDVLLFLLQCLLQGRGARDLAGVA